MITGAVIVAAGMSSCIESFKPMLKIGSISAVERIIYTFQQAHVDHIVVVTGNQAEVLEKHLSGTGIVFLRNGRYRETEMLDSAKIGLDYLRKCGRVFFTPVDIPLFSVTTVKHLLHSSGKICIPIFNGVEGHPLLISSDLIETILKFCGDNGIRGALNCTGYSITPVCVEDEGVLLDMDTPEEYENLVGTHNKQLLRPILNVCLAREDVFFDRLDGHLLEIILETNSVKLACERLKISYSSGWKKLNLIEKNLGNSVVSKSRGGIGGGYTELTKEGLELLELYHSFEKECQKFAEDNFYKWFSHLKE
jgi:molybdate transport repressor ModE-like protein